MKKFYLSVGISLMVLVGCNEHKKSTCICTTTYSGEGSEYFEDETVTFTSDNGCENSDSTISEDGLNIRLVCREE